MRINLKNILQSRLFHHNIQNSKTIYALSSGLGKCGVAVIRLSGNKAGDALKTITNMKELPKPRFASLKFLYHPINKEILDRGLVLWFPGPNSFTGEDCCEFQIHGGTAVITSLLNALQTIPNLQPAEPGEFTRRAFYNGKMDLTEVEGLSDLLEAETEMQRKQALLASNGHLSNLYNSWRKILLKSVANVEACIDFEESESLDDPLESVFLPVRNLRNDIDKHLQDGRRGELLRNGIKTVIIGEPNAGKSSLYNILCQRPAAIVSPTAGTTRDILQTTLDINGYPLIITDTAGLRKSTTDLIEQEGMHRALEAVQEANFVVALADVQQYLHSQLSVAEFVRNYFTNLGISQITFEYLFVLNKSDLVGSNHILKQHINNDENIVLLSCLTRDGVECFIKKLTNHLQNLCGKVIGEQPCMSRQRHRHALSSCLEYLDRFLNISNQDKDIVLMAQDLRSALRQLAKITGIVTTEQLLDVIFKDFCIGK